MVVEYRKARALTATLAQSSPIWQNLFLEVDKVRASSPLTQVPDHLVMHGALRGPAGRQKGTMAPLQCPAASSRELSSAVEMRVRCLLTRWAQGVEGMAEQLRGVLAAPRTTAPEAAAPMRLLLQLQADGAATVQPLNPVKLYLDTQVRLQEAGQGVVQHPDFVPASSLSNSCFDRLQLLSIQQYRKACCCKMLAALSCAARPVVTGEADVPPDGGLRRRVCPAAGRRA